MSITPRRRRRPLLGAGILTTLVALALPGLAPAATTTPTSTHRVTTHHSTSKKKKKKRKRTPPKPLTNAQIIALIKKNEKPGPQGTQGPVGPSGANGAVAGYSAVGAGGPLTGTTTVVSKALPAGIYIVHAKVVVNANSGSSGIAAAECDLLNGTTILDTALWTSPLSSVPGLAGVFVAASTLPVEGGLATSTPTTVSLQCFASGPSASLTASYAQLQAVQVNTAN